MARYQHLPIYKLTYELLKRVTNLTKNFSREYKFTIGQKLENEVLELVVIIYRINSSESKVDCIDLLLERLQVVELLLRLSFDMKLINTKSYAAVVEMTASIGKQAQGWKRSKATSKK